jgi:hypothetical protein
MSDRPEEPKLPLYREYEALAEQAYDDLYEGRVAGRWTDIKDFLAMAIASAEREGLSEEAERLRKRLEHIRKVVYSQFS